MSRYVHAEQFIILEIVEPGVAKVEMNGAQFNQMAQALERAQQEKKNGR